MAEKNNKELLASFLRLRKMVISNTKSFQRKFSVFLVFLALSTIAWFYRSLQDTYITDIHYPVRYINLPEGKMLINTPPKQLNLRVRSDGFTILKNKVKFKLPIKFDVNAFSGITSNVDSTSFFILTNYAKEKLQNDLDRQTSDIEIISISPDTISFSITEIKSKTVPVVGNFDNINQYIEKQFRINGSVYFTPDSVRITGPKYIVDSIKHVTTKAIQVVNMTDTTMYKTELNKISRVDIVPSQVKTIVPIDKATEKIFNLKVGTRNVPDSILLKTFPTEVKVSFIVTLHNYELAGPSFFNAYVDYNDIISDETSALKVYLDSLPDFIFSAKTQPRYVEILREKRDTENRTNRGDR